MNNTKTPKSLTEEVNFYIQNRIPESQSLEYKEQINLKKDNDKKEFLADISSFGNTISGKIIYGVSEAKVSGKNTGTPDKIVGIDYMTIDEIKKCIESLFQTGLSPKLINYNIEEITLEGKKLLLIDIKKNSTDLHMINIYGSSKFYKRNSAGKYPLGYAEIKNSILGQSHIKKVIEQFKLDRLNDIQFSDLNPNENNAGIITIHLLPLESFTEELHLDFSTLYPLTSVIFPLFMRGGCNSLINFDGIMQYSSSNKEKDSFTQIFHNGCLEGVDYFCLNSKNKIIPSLDVENNLIGWLIKAFECMKRLNIYGGAVLYVNFLNVKGFEMGTYQTPLPFHQKQKIQKENLNFPEIFIEDTQTANAIEILNPIIKLMWNACGYSDKLK